MRLRHVFVQNYRGIRHLEWKVESRFNVLIGPGDGAKTTILDAIALALSPRWSHTFGDHDFFEGVTSDPIVIEVTVSEIPDELLREDRYGHWMRGIDENGSIRDEPADDDEPALTIRLLVTDSLEPQWTVVKDALVGDERTISATHRASLGAFRVDESATHLRWSTGSALSLMTDGADVRSVVTQAQRTARESVFGNPHAKLAEVARRAGALAARAGAADLSNPRPGLEPATSGRSLALSIYDGAVPASQLGRGSQRLASIALQTSALDAAALLLVDEVETGLEPHRLLGLLRSLHDRSAHEQGHTVVTTHSPLVISATDVSNLHIVRRSIDGRTRIERVPEDLEDMRASGSQAVARAVPAALLSKRIVVCEGKTEVGLLRRLLESWDDEEAQPSALLGLALAHGGGNSAPDRARSLAKLGFEVGLLVDGDLTGSEGIAFASKIQGARDVGVEVWSWPDGQCVEDAIFASLPINGVQALVDLHRDHHPGAEQSLRATVASRLQVAAEELDGVAVDGWASQAGLPLAEVVRVLGRVADTKKWFKDETWGYRVGELLLDCWHEVAIESPLREVIIGLREFCYRGASRGSAVIAALSVDAEHADD